jgi:hypothetical protein
MKTLAEEVYREAQLPADTLPSMLGGYLRITFPDATARLDAARIEGSKAAVEDVDGIADEAVADAAQASRARNRMAARQYRAEVWDRSLRDKGPAVQVNLSVGEMRLEALRMRDSVATPTQQLGVASAPQLAAGQPADLADLL